MSTDSMGSVAVLSVDDTASHGGHLGRLQNEGQLERDQAELKQKDAQLTDDGLQFSAGKEDDPFGRLQQRLGKSKEDLRDEIAKR